MERMAFITRAYEMAGYALYKAAEERGNPFFTMSEMNDVINTSPYSYNFPRTSKLKDIAESLRGGGLVEFIFVGDRQVAIEVKACPYVPQEAVKEGHEQEAWFSGKKREELLEELLKKASTIVPVS